MVCREEPWVISRLEEVVWGCMDGCAEVCVSAIFVISAEAPNEADLWLLRLRDYHTANELFPLNVLDCFWYDEALEDKKKERKNSNFKMAIAWCKMGLPFRIAVYVNTTQRTKLRDRDHYGNVLSYKRLLSNVLMAWKLSLGDRMSASLGQISCFFFQHSLF